MKFVALVSGGKDSLYSVLEAIKLGHELVCCGHLAPRRSGEEEEESYMYQTAASECISTQVEECLGVPLFVRECKGRSQDTSLVYDHGADGSEKEADEVEDMHRLLESIVAAHPEIMAVTSGAILSTYQRTRIESVCSRLSLTPLSYLWRIGPQRSLLQCMLEDGMDIVLVKVASPPGLVPHRHLNKSLAELFYSGHLDRLKERFDFSICGEGGEYETLVLDCPIFRKRLVLDEVEILEPDNDGVGVLKVVKCHAKVKEGASNEEWKEKEPLHARVREMDGEQSADATTSGAAASAASPAASQPDSSITSSNSSHVRRLPHVKRLLGGLFHVSEILSSTAAPASDDNAEADLAVQEALDVLSTLQVTLAHQGATPQDVVYVHLYLSNISHFAKINQHYSAFFGTVLPPSRSCVAVGRGVLPGARRVLLDCLVQRGSGRYMRPPSAVDDGFVRAARNNRHHPLRSTLHVQSRSHWAPICVGPYSQANTVRGGFLFLAGQIGLDPPTMTLAEGGWRAQLQQSWTNAASVLDALDGSLNDCLSGLIYIGSDIINNDNNSVWDEVQTICRRALESNGNVSAGYVDEKADTADKWGGYEDEGTYREMCAAVGDRQREGASDVAKLPLLMVALPQMPVGAIAEVELVCASSRASSCLSCSYSSSNFIPREANVDRDAALLWDLGYEDGEPSPPPADGNNDIAIISSVGFLGSGCAAIVCSAAYVDNTTMALDTRSVLHDLLDSSIQCIEETAGLGKRYALHVRLYYCAPLGSNDDGILLRSELNVAVAGKWSGVEPAVTVVPVTAMKLMPARQDSAFGHKLTSRAPIMAMQVMACDCMHLETDMWIENGRSSYSSRQV